MCISHRIMLHHIGLGINFNDLSRTGREKNTALLERNVDAVIRIVYCVGGLIDLEILQSVVILL